MPLPMTYIEIVEDLTARIRSGEYPPGSKLPSYNELKDLYSVSFATIARVMSILRDRGAIIGAPGRGTFVPD